MSLFLAGALALVPAACVAPKTGPADCTGSMVIRQFPSMTELDRYPLDRDPTFSLSFIHSVSKTPVQDDYRIIGDRIVQTAEIFQAHGAGLPSMHGEPGATGWEHVNDQFILHLQRPIDRLVVRTDKQYRNRLYLGEMEVDLNQWKDQALEVAFEPCQAN